jgi:hypothetical protein
MFSLLSSSPCGRGGARPLNRVLLGQPNNDSSLITFVNQHFDAYRRVDCVGSISFPPLVKVQAFKEALWRQQSYAK